VGIILRVLATATAYPLIINTYINSVAA